jgi:hypothetical protein
VINYPKYKIIKYNPKTVPKKIKFLFWIEQNRKKNSGENVSRDQLNGKLQLQQIYCQLGQTTEGTNAILPTKLQNE